MGWFLYDWGLRHELVKEAFLRIFKTPLPLILSFEISKIFKTTIPKNIRGSYLCIISFIKLG